MEEGEEGRVHLIDTLNCLDNSLNLINYSDDHFFHLDPTKDKVQKG